MSPDVEPTPASDRAVYVISVAAELTGLHPQTLRSYDRLGLVRPGRTGGGGRRYSWRDIELLREVADHSGEAFHLEGVRRILDGAGLTEADLQTPPGYPLDDDARDQLIRAGGAQSSIAMNCSGKHAAMLAVCAARGWPREGYRRPDHPLQQEIAALVAGAAGLQAPPPTAVDGCGVVTFALSLVEMARAFGRLGARELEGADRVVSAMIALPELVEGPGQTATEVMKELPGAVAKGGAEGVLCVGLEDGSALALKAEDGSSRPVLPAAAALLDLTELRTTTVRNSRGEAVGAVLVES